MTDQPRDRSEQGTEQPPDAADIAAGISGDDAVAEPREDYDPERRDAAGAPLPGEDPGDMDAHGGSVTGGPAHS